ncbi:cell division protein FtsW [bacterium]|nr:cell division protein FtsW [bacterium]
MMNRKGQPDIILLSVTAILVLIGILVIYSASSFRGAEDYSDAFLFIKKHLIKVALALFFMLISYKIDYRFIKYITPFSLLAFILLLFFVLSGPKINGSRRAISLMGMGFQPSEFMKLILICYMAALFSKSKGRISENRETLIIHYFIFLSIVVLVFIEPDLGTALVMFFIGLTMLFIGGVPGKKLAVMAAAPVPFVALGFAIFPYQMQRLRDFWNSVFNGGSMSYQVKQSIIGLAHGGLAGVGYGAGKQKLFFLPEPFSDFVLASYGEEMGFIGMLFLFLLLVIVLWRGIHIAVNSQDRYGFLLAGGITAMILINALMNAGVVVNLLPTTGLPFPFLSYGGSSLIVHMIGIGILLNISKRNSQMQVGSFEGISL